MWVDMSYMDGKGSSWSCLLGIHRAFCFDLAALGSHWSRYIHAAPCSYIQMCLLENMFTWFGSSSTCNIENRISRALSITSSLPLSTERYITGIPARSARDGETWTCFQSGRNNCHWFQLYCGFSRFDHLQQIPDAKGPLSTCSPADCAAHVHDYLLFFDFMYNYPINLSLHVKGQGELETTMQVYGTFRHPLCRGFVCIKQSLFLFFGRFPPILQARKRGRAIFFASCAIGLRTFSWTQVMVLSIGTSRDAP